MEGLDFNPKWILKRTLSIISRPSIIVLRIQITVQLESQTEVCSGFQFVILRVKWRLASIQHLNLNSTTTLKYWMPPKALGLWESEKTVIFSVNVSTTCESYSHSRWVLHHNAPRKCILASSMSWWAVCGIWPGVSPEQDGNSGAVDSVSHIAKGGFWGFIWQCGWGTRGWESLLWHNCPHPHWRG